MIDSKEYSRTQKRRHEAANKHTLEDHGRKRNHPNSYSLYSRQNRRRNQEKEEDNQL